MKRNLRKPGFTIVELLLVIAIIAVFSAMALVAVRGAQNEASKSATIARMNQIRTVLLDRLEDYQTRKLPINLSDLGYDLTPSERRQIGQRIIADMILTEMPTVEINMQNSVIDASVEQYPSRAFGLWLQDLETRLQNDGSGRYMTDLAQTIRLALTSRGGAPIMVDRVREFASPNNDKNEQFNLQAEFLHEILRLSDRDGQSGIEVLTNRGISNTDGDNNVMEIVDAWGEPVGFQFNYPIVDGGEAFLTLAELIRDQNNQYPFIELNKIEIALSSRRLNEDRVIQN